MNKKICIVRIFLALSILLLIVVTAAFYSPITPCETMELPQTVRTRAQRQAARNIFDVISHFYTVETPFATIRFTEPDSAFIPAINSIVSMFYPALLNDFDLTLNNAGRMYIIVFPDQQTLEAAMGRRYSHVPMGVFFAGIINISSPTMWATGNEDEILERFTLEGPVLHEIVHFVLDVKTNGNYPRWFTEGVALFYEYKYTAFEWRPDLRYAAAQLCAVEVTTNFRYLCVLISYRKVFDIIANYVNIHGEVGLQEIITELGRGTPHDEVLAAVLSEYVRH